MACMLGRGVRVFAGEPMAGAEALFWMTFSFFLRAARRALMLATTVMMSVGVSLVVLVL
jgi:hypothetical protein